MQSIPDADEDQTLLKRLMRLLLWFAFIESDDPFVEKLRKAAVSVLVACTASPLAFAIYLFHRAYSVQEEPTTGIVLAAIFCMSFVPLCIIPYVVSRARGQVSTIMMDIVMVCLNVFLILLAISWPSFGIRAGAIGAAVLGIISQTRFVAFHAAFCGVTFVLDAYNQAFRLEKDGPPLLLVSGYHYGPPLEDFIGMVAGGGCCAVIVIGAFLQSKQHGVQVAEGLAALDLCHRVVDQLRKYDTDGVENLLNNHADGVNVALVASLQAMNGNLKQYKPYLPNFLFTSEDSRDDEEGDGTEDTETVGSSKLTRSVKSFKSDNSDETSDTSKGSMERSMERSGRGLRSASVAHYAQNQKMADSSQFCRISCAMIECPRSTKSNNNADVVGMTAFIDAVHLAAKEMRAAIHTLVGDAVIASWNGASRVGNHEVKSCTFAARLMKVAKAGAVFTGQARFYSITSSSRQHAHTVDAAWMSALGATFRLAQDNGVFLIDEVTRVPAEGFVKSCMVDYINYGLDKRNEITFSCSLPPQTPVNDEKTGYRHLFQLMGENRQSEGDNEWMYALDQTNAQADDSLGTVEKATQFVIDGERSKAAEVLDSLGDAPGLPSMVKRISAAAHWQPM